MGVGSVGGGRVNRWGWGPPVTAGAPAWSGRRRGRGGGYSGDPPTRRAP